MAKPNRYQRIIEHIFLSHYKPGATSVPFKRDEIVRAAKNLGIKLPKNLGDIVYSFRYRADLPRAVRDKAPEGEEWVIRPAGSARYKFELADQATIVPNSMLSQVKVPDSTSGIIAMYALSDEQALLARLRYNRLIDVFTGVTCYSLQSHLRTTVPDVGQVETDEVYVGVDRRGAHYVFPVQAKGGSDTLNVVQIEQDFAMCATKFPTLICRPIGAQFMDTDLISLFEFERAEGRVSISQERHYRLVPPDEITPKDIATYRAAP